MQSAMPELLAACNRQVINVCCVYVPYLSDFSDSLKCISHILLSVFLRFHKTFFLDSVKCVSQIL